MRTESLCSFGGGKSGGQPADGASYPDVGHAKLGKLRFELTHPQHPDVIATTEGQQPDRRGFEQVIADQVPSRRSTRIASARAVS